MASNASTESKKAHGLKEKALEELRKFWAIAVYLAVVFAAFTWYRRFILSESGISYFHYGAAVVQALVLAKVIMLGQALGIGKRYEGGRLVWSVLFKTVEFAVAVALFTVLEHLIEGLFHRESWDEISRHLVRAGRDEILARTVMIFVTFVPFFAFYEADRVLGSGTLFRLFFGRRSA
jgi:hypothetical protein